ncbi:hypothetical protein FRC17_001511 [Serendipita sp. 399]|nr:hypothetical protein FRC17_001511 [Serendipita sp. 399]
MRSNPLIRSATRRWKERAFGRDKQSHEQPTKASIQDGLQQQPQKVSFQPHSTREKSHWEVYNDLALVYDREMIKEWDDSLSLMLVFGALFSGVLTAFIVRSLDLLTEEENPPINVILQTISHQLANFSTEPYTYVPDPNNTPPRMWTVKVNALFFTSLGCTLAVSLASVLCLQWVRDFDKGLASITNPAERALKRQFRLEGMKKWYLPTIIGVLPTLLVIALILFMAGLVVWMRGISRTVTAISCIILILGGSFYVSTALFAAIWPSAPFNSPASRLLEFLLLVIYRSFQNVSQRLLTRMQQKKTNDNTEREAREWETLPSTIETETAAFLKGHRHREDEAIASDPKLPAASHLWLLAHLDITTGTLQRLEDLLRSLLDVESPEAMLESYGKYKVPWSKMLEFMATQIDPTEELDRPSFEPKTLAKLEVLAQVAGTVGRASHSALLFDVFSATPTTLPDFQASPVGVAIRFVRWMGGYSMPVDQFSPIHLFRDLARVSAPAGGGGGGEFYPAFTLAWLVELRRLLLDPHETCVDRAQALEVLIELCEAQQTSSPVPFFTQENRSVQYSPDVLREVIRITGVIFGVTKGNGVKPYQPLHELFGTLAGWYEALKRDQDHHQRHQAQQQQHQSPSSPSVGKEEQEEQTQRHWDRLDLLMKYLVHALLLEFAGEQASPAAAMDVQLRAISRMRHPSIRALILENPELVSGIEVKPESTSTDHHYQYVKEGLQALAVKEKEHDGARWRDEIANLLFGYLRQTMKAGALYDPRERRFAVEVLFAVAYLVSEERDSSSGQNGGGGGGRSTIVGFWNGRDQLTVVLDSLAYLSSVMDNPSSAFMISSGIGSYVIPLLGKGLEQVRTEVLEEKVDRIEDRTLRWYAYQVLGWEYHDVLPNAEEDADWENPCWRQALFEWSMLPLRSREADSDVLVALAKRGNREHDLVILNYFSTRLSEQKPEDTEYGRNQVSSSRQLLSAALSVFPLAPHLTTPALGFMNKLLDFPESIRYFIDDGGLDWLATLPHDAESSEGKTDHLEEDDEGENGTNATKVSATSDPFQVLYAWRSFSHMVFWRNTRRAITVETVEAIPYGVFSKTIPFPSTFSPNSSMMDRQPAELRERHKEEIAQLQKEVVDVFARREEETKREIMEELAQLKTNRSCLNGGEIQTDATAAAGITVIWAANTGN